MALGVVVALGGGAWLSSGLLRGLLAAAAFATLLPVAVSLGVSWWVYDRSELYRLDWLGRVPNLKLGRALNIHSGFDETSELLRERVQNLVVFDFYDPAAHTEASIARARRAYDVFEGTQVVKTTALPLPDDSVDTAFVIFAAHEIRDDAERAAFFCELGRVLKADGHMVVTEHLRDAPNALAYTAGVFHFLSKRTWQKTFERAGLRVSTSFRITPFVTTFVLKKIATGEATR
ncbi:methyltransferase [Bradymonas sediminis]|uniref:Methyltransferase n=2 Tax=Bradymonas sediminis TaxID=1548548 RepID=A0A2Z4FQW0_9DELT|nr:methyltransferase [Bradymonas sediminis]